MRVPARATQSRQICSPWRPPACLPAQRLFSFLGLTARHRVIGKERRGPLVWLRVRRRYRGLFRKCCETAVLRVALVTNARLDLMEIRPQKKSLFFA